jgi:hypothetical protein
MSRPWPERLSINAWDGGEGAVSASIHNPLIWALRSQLPQSPKHGRSKIVLRGWVTLRNGCCDLIMNGVSGGGM